MTGKKPSGPRCAALIGPYLSGKTSLMEAMLHAAGTIPRRGTVQEGNTVGAAAAEARARNMSVEVTPARMRYLDESWTLLDCPGSIELLQETVSVLPVVDVAVVVVEPIAEKALAAAPLFRLLDEQAIPHMVFVNKMDNATSTPREILEALQAVSDRPLVLRQVPIHEGEGVVGYVDLVSERAYRYKEGEASDLIAIPESEQDEEQVARQELLESLADFDDGLLEQLLEDIQPPRDDIYGLLARTLAEDRLVPVFLGAATKDSGVRRLLKALRHETPDVGARAEARGLAGAGEPAVQVFKTFHLPHAGKLSLGRVMRGEIADGTTLNGERVGGLFHLLGTHQSKVPKAGVGEVVGLGRMESVKTGAILTPSGARPEGAAAWPAPLKPLYAAKVTAASRNDEVKMTAALARLTEEDPSISLEHNADTHEMLIWGRGEMHLAIAVDRLKSRFHLDIATNRPQVPYKETIRRGTSQHARHKKQSGGHGQFADIHIDIRPLPRGSGFDFSDTVTGGAVPKQYIPAVEAGVKEYLARGPLGFPVVDVAVTLTDGQFHTVDSSDMAFKIAARMGMSEGMPKCDPVLLEPILKVTVLAPAEYTSNVQRLLSGRRGQILGFEPREGWSGWDEVTAYLPQSEVHDMIVELRSLTQGVGTFDWEFDHLQELQGRIADDVVAARSAA